MKNMLIPRRRRNGLMRAERDEHPFDLLHREINELFDARFGGSGWRDFPSGFEVSETDDEIQVKAELPGMDEKDIDIKLDGDVLTIRGERKQEKETKKRNYHVSEMSYGGYSRTIPLPAEVDATKAKAKFKRGVLTLNLPKTEQAKAARKRIPIRTD